MSKSYRLVHLSEFFYAKYNPNDYPEMEHKPSRPYLMLVLEVAGNSFAIPFRTNISHKYGYKFKNSNRQTNSVTGIDYTKAVVINDAKYIGEDCDIDNKEYIELEHNIHLITRQFTKYVLGYREYLCGNLNEFECKKYKYSTLKYFHEELHLDLKE